MKTHKAPENCKHWLKSLKYKGQNDQSFGELEG